TDELRIFDAVFLDGDRLAGDGTARVERGEEIAPRIRLRNIECRTNADLTERRTRLRAACDRDDRGKRRRQALHRQRSRDRLEEKSRADPRQEDRDVDL